MNDFKVYAICPSCDTRYVPAFGKVFHLDFVVCPTCGTDKTNFYTTTVRYVSTAKWLNPSTWGDGYYEDLKDD